MLLANSRTSINDYCSPLGLYKTDNNLLFNEIDTIAVNY